MHSTHHAVLSFLTSTGAVLALDPRHPIVLLLVGTVVGVAIDLDHFPIARAKVGDWRSARRVLATPLLVVTDPERIFSDAQIHPLERVVTHVVLGVPLALGTWVWWPALGIVLGASLSIHLLADVAWDLWRLQRS